MISSEFDLAKPTEGDVFKFGGENEICLKIGEILLSSDNKELVALGRYFSQAARMAPKEAQDGDAPESPH